MASISMGADSGGREAIERLLKAYGLKTKQSLSEQLGVSKAPCQTGCYVTAFLLTG